MSPLTTVWVVAVEGGGRFDGCGRGRNWFNGCGDRWLAGGTSTYLQLVAAMAASSTALSVAAIAELTSVSSASASGDGATVASALAGGPPERWQPAKARRSH